MWGRKHVDVHVGEHLDELAQRPAAPTTPRDHDLGGEDLAGVMSQRLRRVALGEGDEDTGGLVREGGIRAEELHLLLGPLAIPDGDGGHLPVQPGRERCGTGDDVVHAGTWGHAQHDPRLDLPWRVDTAIAHVRDQAAIGVLREYSERELAQRREHLWAERACARLRGLAGGHDLTAPEAFIEE